MAINIVLRALISSVLSAIQCIDYLISFFPTSKEADYRRKRNGILVCSPNQTKINLIISFSFITLLFFDLLG